MGTGFVSLEIQPLKSKQMQQLHQYLLSKNPPFTHYLVLTLIIVAVLWYPLTSKVLIIAIQFDRRNVVIETVKFISAIQDS